MCVFISYFRLKNVEAYNEISVIDKKQQMSYVMMKVLFAFVFLTKYRRCNVGSFSGNFSLEILKTFLFVVLLILVETMLYLFNCLQHLEIFSNVPLHLHFHGHHSYSLQKFFPYSVSS